MAILFLAKGNTLHEESHVAGQNTHGLQSLVVMSGLPFQSSMYTVPILAGSYRHAGDRKVLVELIESSGTSAPSGYRNTGADFHCFVKTCAVEQPVQTCDQSRVCGCIVDGRSNHKAVRFLKLRRDLIDDIVKHALSVFCTGVAGNTSADGFVADTDDFGLNAFLFEYLDHLIQRETCVTAHAGTSVQNQYFHICNLLSCSCVIVHLMLRTNCSMPARRTQPSKHCSAKHAVTYVRRPSSPSRSCCTSGRTYIRTCGRSRLSCSRGARGTARC